ncbi:hypothetical protein [Actinocrispum wychmicini]|uniref:Uncharacterized protein n=1 Tax=Actinocrispum wychmicini TaxID=1213861 RepID=A0A4R2JFW6_9PSEU|nr:hypothetical protein [Actinocrispum wychmicini]TCO57142.1 hypothetical protein EV192_106619 [Actinocrispum wychmicini]
MTEQPIVSTRVRAKFRCISETRTRHTPDQDLPVTYRFQAMYDAGLPEDERLAKYTPSGHVEIQVDNPRVEFTPGQDYYLDFTPAAQQ